MQLNKKIKPYFYKFWDKIDHTLFILVATAILFGLLMLATAGPASSERINISGMHFFTNQIVYAFIAIFIILFFSAISPHNLTILVYIGFSAALVGLLLLPVIGEVNKGARRWMNLGGISLQPSEIIKPFYAFVTAKILTYKNTLADDLQELGREYDQHLKYNLNNTTLPKADQNSKNSLIYKIYVSKNGHFVAAITLLIPIVGLIVTQPDLGMTMTISLATLVQLFVANLPWLWIIVCGLGATAIFFFAYLTMPHVAQRINLFLNGGEKTGVAYQVEKSLISYQHGGMFGVGPGEGTIKYQLPDSHTDFIFAVTGEEFGAISCLMVIALFCSIVLRCLYLALKTEDNFSTLTITGITTYIAFQSIFNIGVTLNLFPTKGMTLPFISYGGSALISAACGIGIILNLVATSRQKREDKIIHIKY